MFTQLAPALVNTLRSAMPARQSQPLVTSLANCQQPLAHRASINVAPGLRTNRDGTARPGRWDPGSYPGLLPDSGGQHTDIAGMSPTWNAGNQYDSQFYFPTNQFFNLNQLLGGPSINLQAVANIDYITNQVLQTGVIETKEIQTNTINNVMWQPLAGPPGQPGQAGRPGAPGAPGGNNGVLQGQFRGLQHLRGLNPRVTFDRRKAAAPHSYVSDGWVQPLVEVGVPTNAISGGTVSVTPSSASVSIPTGVTFDPATCEVTFSGYTTITYATTDAVTGTVAGTAAASTKYKMLAITGVTTSLASTGTKGVILEFVHADTPTFDAVQNPRLRDVTPDLKVVLHR